MAAEEGKKAPAFTAVATDGKKISLKDFAGTQAVVLNRHTARLARLLRFAVNARRAAAGVKGASVLRQQFSDARGREEALDVQHKGLAGRNDA